MLFLPDEIVDLSLEHLCYEGLIGISIDGLFQLISSELQSSEDSYKSIVFSWLVPNNNIQFIDADGNIVEKSQITTLKEFDSSKYLIRVTEEYQWLILTNTTKDSNLIPNAAFQLLAEIARHREKGIDSFSLTKATGQDARSLTQRIKALGNLIKKTSIVKNGRSLSLFVLSKFSQIGNHDGFKINDEPGEITINIDELREKITTSLKVAKSTIRQYNDLRRELEMDKTKKYRRVFRSCVNYLATKGYLTKVMVISPSSPTKKFRSLKYLKDYVKSDANNDSSSDSDENENEDEDGNENDDIDDEFIDDELKSLGANDPSASLKSTTSLEVVDATKSNIIIPSFNRIYPLQNQVYDLVDSLGTTGCSSNYIVQYIFGHSFQRLYDRLIQSYTSDKLLSYIANYGIIRHYDFQGRVKFYRYISRKNLLVYSNQPEDPNGSSFPPYKSSKNSIHQLNSKSFKPMVGSVGVYKENGESLIAWSGPHSTSSLNIRISSTTGLPMKRRGRPKKDEVKIKEVEPVQDIPKDDEVNDDTLNKSSYELKDEEPTVIITDIQGTSFRSIETQAAILRLIEDSDGVRKNDNNLLNELREELGYNIFRATYLRDLDSLIKQQKIIFENFVIDDEIGTTISLLITPSTSQSIISNYKSSIFNEGKQTSYEKVNMDELSLDIDFFDTELRETFNKAPPPPKISIKAEKPAKTPKLTKTERGVKPTKTVKAKLPKIENEIKQTPNKLVNNNKESVESREEDIFESIKKKNRVNKRNRRSNVPQSENNQDIIHEKKPKVGKRNRRHITNLSSEQALEFFKCAIICKTLTENQIDWEKVSDVTGHSIDVLRVKWPRIRTMMGPLGIKNARNTWKKILILAVKEGRVEMEDVENLDLDVLLDLWRDSELLNALNVNGEKLYASIEDNEKEFGFVKFKTPSLFYDNNSMIQREHCLIDNVSTFKEEEDEIIPVSIDDLSEDEQIRNLIIAIVASGTQQDIKKLGPLEKYNEEDVNRVFLEMAKNRELLISGSTNSVILGDRLTSILDDHSYLLSLNKIPKFQTLFHELVESKKGLLLSPVFEDELMVPILDLISQDTINLTRVDHYRKDILIGYEARTIERDNFESEIIITQPKSNDSIIKTTLSKKIVVPSGNPCSHLWIGLNGQINKEIWLKTLKVFVTNILSNPGITYSSLFQIVDPLLSKIDFELVLNWLIQSNTISKRDSDGYWLEPQWYMSLGL